MKSPSHGKRLFIGIDRGGTSVRYCLMDSAGRTIKMVKLPSVDIRKFPAQIKCALDRENVPPSSHAVIATRGAISKHWKIPFLKNALKGRLKNLEVISDLQAAYCAALEPGEGFLLLSGTGSAAFALTVEGRPLLSGGLGPALGDEGSGFWIGKTWLAAERGISEIPDRNNIRKTAAHAREEIDLAMRKDPVASGVVELAALRLSETACRLLPELSSGKTISVTWGGSVMENAFFRKRVISALKLMHPKLNFKQKRPRRTPAEAAALLALKRFKGDCRADR